MLEDEIEGFKNWIAANGSAFMGDIKPATEDEIEKYIFKSAIDEMDSGEEKTFLTYEETIAKAVEKSGCAEGDEMMEFIFSKTSLSEETIEKIADAVDEINEENIR